MALPAFDILSIASGGGGLDRAVELAAPGSRVVCHVEREAFAASVLVDAMAKGFVAEAPVWSDARTFDGAGFRGCVDLVTAGIPCQGYSLAGKRRLQHDERDLWDATRTILRDVGAEWLFLENVRGLLIPGSGVAAGITRILGELALDGWDAEWCGLRASDVGASHGRFRVFILAHRRCDDGAGRGGRAELDGPTSGAQGEALERERLRNTAGDGGADVAHRAGGGLGELRKPPRGDGQPDGCDGTVDDAARNGDARSHGQGRSGRGVCEVGGTLDDAQRAGARQGEQGEPGQRRDRPSDANGELADAGLARRQGSVPAGPETGPTGRGRRAGLPVFAPGPADPRWADILAQHPDLAPAVEPPLRGVADGVAANRRDWLRLLGNGVVDLQGAAALRILWARLHGESH